MHLYIIHFLNRCLLYGSTSCIALFKHFSHLHLPLQVGQFGNRSWEGIPYMPWLFLSYINPKVLSMLCSTSGYLITNFVTFSVSPHTLKTSYTLPSWYLTWKNMCQFQYLDVQYSYDIVDASCCTLRLSSGVKSCQWVIMTLIN